jgi:predicted RNA-binding protein with PIN domain
MSNAPWLIVDAMNVIGSRPDGWWRHRHGAIRRFVAQLGAWARLEDAGVTVVIDGRPISGLPDGDHDDLEVVYARRRGPDAADDRIVELVEADHNPSALRVVTSDRELRRRVAALGAEVESAGWLLRRLEGFEAAAE